MVSPDKRSLLSYALLGQRDNDVQTTILDVLRGRATTDQLEHDAPPCHQWDRLGPEEVAKADDAILVVANPGQPLSDQAIEGLARLLVEYDRNQHGFCRAKAA